VFSAQRIIIITWRYSVAEDSETNIDNDMILYVYCIPLIHTSSGDLWDIETVIINKHN
jgi:hypothetical protein